MEAHHLRPPEAEDAAEFVAAMRALRVRSGYSFRALERRAATLGEVLPTSTLNSALSRSTLPREQIVVAFVRACGGDEETAAAWARVRADLAATEVEPDSAPAPTPEPEVPEPEAAEPETIDPPAPVEIAEEPPVTAGRRSRALAVVLGLLAVVLAIVLVVVLNRAPQDQTATGPTSTTTTTAETTAAATTTTTAETTQPAPAPQNPPQNPPPNPATTTVPTTENRPEPPPNSSPRNGIQRIRLSHTGLCVGEGQERFSGSARIVLGQHDCATATPPTELERLPDGSFRIKLHNADYGIGCATVDYGGTDTGVLIAGTNCGNRVDQQFTLEPVATGYLLHSVPGARYCIGVYGGSREPGTQLIQNPCDGGAHQVFQLG
ncbi:RICIN domain-containing protein [Saccharothrix variisporea]|uniref:Ricin-type beta-trefoil lectin protein n=1 Tax=Saccharothrix variisporea TaxID=543527 RepID=A0A495XCT5_9PSEU|nr:RICIN domain-containing protein [Saccharothrix variisporea]RKT70413.1 hypothetical protein DFJ66_3673 [Saccharothrix variisporea]